MSTKIKLFQRSKVTAVKALDTTDALLDVGLNSLKIINKTLVQYQETSDLEHNIELDELRAQRAVTAKAVIDAEAELKAVETEIPEVPNP